MCHTWDPNLQYSKSIFKSSMGRVDTPCGDLLILDDLLTLCAGTLVTNTQCIIELVTNSPNWLLLVGRNGDVV